MPRIQAKQKGALAWMTVAMAMVGALTYVEWARGANIQLGQASRDIQGPKAIGANIGAPTDEDKVFGYVLDKPQIALTNGMKLIDLASARIEGEASVGADGQAQARLRVSAKTSLGPVEIKLETQGLAGVEYDAPIEVNGVQRLAHVRIARKAGCSLAVCPGALRADYQDEAMGVSVDVYSPAR
jgi:hypothetical protein